MRIKNKVSNCFNINGKSIANIFIACSELGQVEVNWKRICDEHKDTIINLSCIFIEKKMHETELLLS